MECLCPSGHLGRPSPRDRRRELPLPFKCCRLVGSARRPAGRLPAFRVTGPRSWTTVTLGGLRFPTRQSHQAGGRVVDRRRCGATKVAERTQFAGRRCLPQTFHCKGFWAAFRRFAAARSNPIEVDGHGPFGRGTGCGFGFRSGRRQERDSSSSMAGEAATSRGLWVTSFVPRKVGRGSQATRCGGLCDALRAASPRGGPAVTKDTLSLMGTAGYSEARDDLGALAVRGEARENGAPFSFGSCASGFHPLRRETSWPLNKPRWGVGVWRSSSGRSS